MADGKTHQLVGATSSAALSLYRSKHQRNWHRSVEATAAAFVGYHASKIPDVLEPAVSSWHRSTAHSVAVAGGIVRAANDALSGYEEWCRAKADALAERRERIISRPWYQDLLLLLGEVFWRAMAGAASGAVAGYLSHLALDAATVRIPVMAIGRFGTS